MTDQEQFALTAETREGPRGFAEKRASAWQAK